MKKIKKLVVANWKMNPVRVEEAKKLFGDVKKAARFLRKTKVVVCPPYLYIPPLSDAVTNTLILGSQNAFSEPLGPYTGEVSYEQLHQFKVGYVLAGHSERRKMGENDKVINKKIKSVIGEGMTAILCVGEEKRDSNGDFFDVIKNQVMLGLKDVSKKLIDHVAIAYEPVWAVGAKTNPTKEEIQEVSIFIKKIVRDMFGILGDSVQIIYGGNVNTANVEAIMKDGFVSGVLIGRESLKTKDFIKIVRFIDSI